VGRWSAEATLEDGGTVSRLRLVAALDSLEVLRGDGGLKPLSEKDKKTILGNAMQTLKGTAHPELVLEASGLQVGEGRSRIDGQMSLAGETGPQTMDLAVTRLDGRIAVTAHAEVVQTAFGIRPYSGMLGALKVTDAVEVRAELSLNLP
jgi:polyisoprenoid-binding protein YceI